MKEAYKNVGNRVPLLQAFKPMLTDAGLCHTLNSEGIGDLYKSSEFMRSIKELLIGSDFYENKSAAESEGGPLRTKGAGSTHKTRIVLDAQAVRDP